MGEVSNVQVVVRVRSPEKKNARSVLQLVDGKKIMVKDKLSDKSFKSFLFDKVFDSETSQDAIFNDVMSPIIEDVLEGYNCTVLAYGQSGTGKTYTIQGLTSHPDAPPDQDPKTGFMARSLGRLFDKLDSMGSDYAVRVSYLAIFNEELIDLLLSREEESKLKLMDDLNKGGVIVQGLDEIVVKNKKKAFEILRKGCERRHTLGFPSSQSSNGHAVFTITVHVKKSNWLGENNVFVGKLNFVDLASTENATGPESLRDVGKSNQSILTLCRVIMALEINSSHVPYRESKLTRILQESLGGSAKTCVIATVSPELANSDETLSTLNMMNKAKSIINTPHPNIQLSPMDLKAYSEEIDRLRRELDACRGNEGFYITAACYSEMIEKINNLNKEKLSILIEKDDEIKNINEKHAKEMELINKKLSMFAETASEAVSDVNKLHDKNEKLSKILEHNEKVFSSFLQKCSTDFSNVQQLTDNTLSEVLGFLDEGANLLEPLQICDPSIQKRIEEKVNNFQRDLEYNLSDLESRIKKRNEDIHNFYNNQMDLIVAKYEDKISNIKNKFHEFVSSSMEEFTKISNEYDSNTESLQKSFDDLVKSCEEKEIHMKNEFASLLEKYSAIEMSVSNIKHSYSTKCKESLELLNSLKENLGKLDDAIRSDSLEKALSENHNRMKNIMKHISDFLETVSKFTVDISSLKQSQQILASKIHEMELILLNNKDNCFSMLESLSGKHHDLRKNCENYSIDTDSDCVNIVEDKVKHVLCTLSNIWENLDDNIKTFVDVMNCIENKVCEMFVVVQDYENKDRGAFASLTNEISENINKIKLEKITAASQIETVQMLTNRFLNEEIKFYTPTGETPKRQDYNVQQPFKGTSPQEQLRERFRRQNILREASENGFEENVG